MKFSVFAILLVFLGLTLATSTRASYTPTRTLAALLRPNFTDDPKPEQYIRLEDLDKCKPPPVDTECMDIYRGFRCGFYRDGDCKRLAVRYAGEVKKIVVHEPFASYRCERGGNPP